MFAHDSDLFVLPDDKETLLAVVGADGEREEVEARLRALEDTRLGHKTIP